ncbi:MAG: T9SS type A sorting domain-containing protein [Bacteroidetes bacterium]|nr:T9SS type A sorting domain-containing protein [Bacteroidota bacterium]
MRNVYLTLAFAFCLIHRVYAQQQATVMGRCGGTEIVTIPSITDMDQDGMDDRLEQKLLMQFMPKIIQFSDESCPGPALDGTGDSNLIACHIYPIPQQYTRSSSYDSILVHPVALVPAHQLVPGLIWYYPKVKVNCAVLYGQDCGALGHTADVEGFNFSLKYTGPDTAAGWMYDTVMSHWMGDTIQTVSHAGTLCQQIETRPMRSLYVSWGADSVYASPDKHGNYLTIGGCGSSIICNPGCGATKQLKHVRPVNLGEPNAAMVADLGSIYAAYAGNDPWTTSNFLSAQGGNAGSIRDKMLLPLNSDFISGHVLTAAQICPLYTQCYGQPGSAYSDQTCAGVPYQFHNRVLTQSGRYSDTLSDSHGCDSVIVLTLHVLSKDTFSYVGATCAGSSFAFHGQQLTTGGTYRDTLTDQHGCDSIVRLDLTVYTATASSYQAVSCDTSYTFHGRVLTASGTYTDTLSDAHGCDSIVALHLTIDTVAQIVWSGSSDTVMAHTHPVLLAVSPGGGLFSGAGVSGNLFFVDSAGPGSHLLTYLYTDPYGCTATGYHTITVLSPAGITDIDLLSIELYPNPVSDILTAVSSCFAHDKVDVRFYDITGQQTTVPYVQTGESIRADCSALSRGAYLVRFESESGYSYKCFVKSE